MMYMYACMVMRVGEVWQFFFGSGLFVATNMMVPISRAEQT